MQRLRQKLKPDNEMGKRKNSGVVSMIQDFSIPPWPRTLHSRTPNPSTAELLLAR